MTNVKAINELIELLPKIKAVFEKEPAVLRIETEAITLVGDIHGNYSAFNNIMENIKSKDVLFLGDYVDRGSQSVEVLVSLFARKLNSPDSVFILRGNHEDAGMNYRDGLLDELDDDEDLLFMIHEVYEAMPVAAVINNKTFCVHGGIEGVKNVNTITKQNSLNYLWNDPGNFKDGFKPSERGTGIKEFGATVFKQFLDLNGFDTMVRGHTFYRAGYKTMFGGRLISLFSCPDYVKGEYNIGATALLTYGKIEVIQFDPMIAGELVETPEKIKYIFGISENNLTVQVNTIKNRALALYDETQNENYRNMADLADDIINKKITKQLYIISHIEDMAVRAEMARNVLAFKTMLSGASLHAIAKYKLSLFGVSGHGDSC
jgi:predicted phosphodiesterase